MEKGQAIVQLESLLEQFIQKSAATVPKVILIAVLAYVTLRILRFFTQRLERFVEEGASGDRTSRKQRTQTLSRVVRGTGSIIVSLIAVMMVVQQLGINIAPIIAGAGIAGLAVGFGAQNLVRDFISGFFILLEDQFSVGDVVRIAGIGGLVESMNLRVTVLRDIEGVVHYVPNGEVKTVSNMTKNWSRALLDVDVAYKEDVDRVISVLKDILEEFRKDPEFGRLLVSEPVIPGVERLGDSSVTVRIMADTVPLKQWDVMRELRRRIKARFDAAGIEIPFPQRTVWLRTEQSGGENTRGG
ncbi:MAG: mechanosensitive ion channel family protein [bacterium]